MASLSIFSAIFLILLTTCHADLISDVCTASLYPAFCAKALGSDPAARAARDLRSLGEVLTGKAKAASQIVLKISKSIGGSPASTCVEEAGDAIDNLDRVSGYLKKGTKSDILTYASSALTDLDTCDEEFGKREPFGLKEATAVGIKFIDILLVIGNKL